MPEISIIIPVYNEEKYIETCLKSILQSSYDVSKMEILLVDGSSEDETLAIVERYRNTYDCIRVLKNPEKITPISMNIGIREAKGEYIFILSAHAKYEKEYFSKLQTHIEALNAECVGAVLHTEVKHKNYKSNAIKEVLQNIFGVGNATFRTGSDKIIEVDTVAFGCYRKSTFLKYGLFNEHLGRNQDIELNKRIVKGGGKIYLIPEVKCTYYARENFTDLAKNSYSNGYWNILTAFYTKQMSALSLRHFIPLLFVFSLILPLSLSFIYPKILWIAIISLLSYLSLVIIISIRIKNYTTSLFYIIMSFIVLHISYGFGSVIGIFSILKKMIKGEQ